MPDYSTLRSTSQSRSIHTQKSIRRRSGAHQSSPSLPPSTSLSHTIDYHHPPDVAQNESAAAGCSNDHATALSPSGASHFTPIPIRSHRSSVFPSRPGPALRSAASTTTQLDTPLSFVQVPLDTTDDTVTSSTSQAIPVAVLYFSQMSTNVQASAKRLSSLACSGLVSLHRKYGSLSNARLPTYNASKPPSPDSRFGLNRALTDVRAKGILSTADKLTYKWPQPRSSRSIPPGLRTNHFATRRMRELKGAGGWSQGNMEVILHESQGLGINWVGQWTLHKWCLIASVTTVFLLGLTCLVVSLLTWFTTYLEAPVLLITDSPALILLTFSSSLLLLASLVGITGTLLNSRPILAVYVLLLFPAFISYVSVGYVTYKKANFSLDAKVSEAWHLWYSSGARLVLQGALGCCGWSGATHGAVASGTCYARSPLPGCHGPLVRFEHDVLSSAAGAVFSLVPLHLANIFVGLLCANHVTHRFGKGITPSRYRLTAHDVLSAGSDIKDGIRRTQLPAPPFPVPTGHAAFREDRQNGPVHRHAHGKFQREREV